MLGRSERARYRPVVEDLGHRILLSDWTPTGGATPPGGSTPPVDAPPPPPPTTATTTA
jgi:hypothetical protein